MKLSPARFNALLLHLGQDVQWRRAYACPCRDPDSGAARQGCPHCLGKGKSWTASVPAYVGLTGMQRQRQWAQMGLWEAGDVVVTLPSDSPIYAIGETDRVAFTDSSDAFSINLTHGQNDAIMPWAVTQVDRLYWLDPDTGLEVEGALPTVDPITHVSTWTVPDPLLPPPALLEPPADMQYSLTGRKLPEFFVWGDLVQTRHHHSGFNLPRHVVLRRFDLFGK
jgi:hypothetical protein